MLLQEGKVGGFVEGVDGGAVGKEINPAEGGFWLLWSLKIWVGAVLHQERERERNHDEANERGIKLEFMFEENVSVRGFDRFHTTNCL